jgi:hypothetical protein
MGTETVLRRLEPPQGLIDAVLDTNAYNEIDDQFAIAYMLAAPEKFTIQAIFAAPFHNEKSDGPEDGMEKSCGEILKILDLAGRGGLKKKVFKGARRFLENESAPAASEASARLAELASARPWFCFPAAGWRRI